MIFFTLIDIRILLKSEMFRGMRFHNSRQSIQTDLFILI